MLVGSPEEAGRYLETYKSYEKKPADMLKEQVEKNYLSKVCGFILFYLNIILCYFSFNYFTHLKIFEPFSVID